MNNKERKGKTWEEIFGDELAFQMRLAMHGNRNSVGHHRPISEELKEANRQRCLNMPQEQRDRIAVALQGRSSNKKGKTYEEIYGEEKASKIRELFSRQRRGVKNKNMAREWKGIGRGPTKIELRICEVLDKFDISYIPSYYIKPYTIDIYLPDKNTIIECDGDYWHSLPNVIEKDKIRDSFFLELGIHTIRFKESDIWKDAENLVLIHVGDQQA